MRRSIIGFVVALGVLAGGAALLTLSAETGVPQAAAQPAALRADGPGKSRSKQALIDDRPPVASQSERPLPAEPKTAAPIKLARRADPRICKVLTEPTQFEFVEAPLQDVVDYLKDRHRIEIQIDAKALEDATISLCEPVTCNLQGISLGAALDLMLHRLNLTYVVDGQVLLITPENSPQRDLVVRLYDCAWAKPNQLTQAVEVVQLLDIGAVASVGADQQSLPEATRDVVAASGFKVVPYGSGLVVRATAVEHETVRRLLAELRTAAEAETAAATVQEKAANPAESKP